MEEYYGLELEGLRLHLRYPSWWLHRMEGDGTYVFQDEYVGTLRLTPRPLKVSEAAAAFAVACAAHPGGSERQVRGHVWYRYDSTATDPDGTPLCVVGFIELLNHVLIESTFTYPQALLDDEFKAEGVEATIEEVEFLLQSIAFEDEDD